MSEGQGRPTAGRVRTAVLLLGGVLAVGVLAIWIGLIDVDLDRGRVEDLVEASGVWGPFMIVALMTVAVVASPIPSAPIALASGAAYGHYAGTAYVALGSEIGALAAFLIARTLGRNAVERYLGENADYGLLGSQNALTLTVFVSRLLPFVSFDAMSYAAGLSRLHFWRFALATLAGILPASFLLAHFGSAAMDGDFGSAEWIVLGLGLATGLPLVFVALKRGRRKSRAPLSPDNNSDKSGT